MGHHKPYPPLMPMSTFKDFLPVRCFKSEPFPASTLCGANCNNSSCLCFLTTIQDSVLWVHTSPLGPPGLCQTPTSTASPRFQFPQQDMLEQHQLLLPPNLLPTLHLPGLLQGERNSFPATLSSSSMAHWRTCQLWTKPTGLLNQLMSASAPGRSHWSLKRLCLITSPGRRQEDTGSKGEKPGKTHPLTPNFLSI